LINEILDKSEVVEPPVLDFLDPEIPQTAVIWEPTEKRHRYLR
jgi:hypothetical protein